MGTSSRMSYVRPELKVYGQIAMLTQSNVSMAMNDPGNGSQSMT